MAREPHALPKSPVPLLPPPESCLPTGSERHSFPSWGLQGPGRDHKQTLAKCAGQGGGAAHARVHWELAVGKLGTARADCHPALGWQGGQDGQARGAGRVGTRGSTGDSSSSRQHPGRVGKSSSAHRGDPGFPRILPQALCHASGRLSPSQREEPARLLQHRSGSPSQRAREATRAGHPVSNSSHSWQV